MRAGPPPEKIDELQLERGGKHGFRHVRGGQGRGKNKYQGVSPKKKHRTKLFETPEEAARAYGMRA